MLHLFHHCDGSFEPLRNNLDNFQVLCTIKADASQLLQDVEPCYGPLGIYYQRDYDIVLSFGLTELKAQLSWVEGVSIYALPHYVFLL
jgi:hypothetical protein